MFAVMAETHEGNIFALRRGLTFDAAESHPVKLSLWKRVWIEEDRKAAPSQPPKTAPLPWRVECMGNIFTYIRDAENRRVMSLHGVEARRLNIEATLREAGLLTLPTHIERERG